MLLRVLPALAVLLALALPAAARADVEVAFLQGEQVVVAARPGATPEDAHARAASPARPRPRRATRSRPPSRGGRCCAAWRSAPTGCHGRPRPALRARARRPRALSARIAQLVLTGTRIAGVQVGPGAGRGRRSRSACSPATRRGSRSRRPTCATPDVPPPSAKPPEPTADPTAATRALQQRLAALGYLPGSGVDGKAGPQTRFAVMAFQKWEGLARDGDAGPATRAALARAPSARRRARSGSRPARRGAARPPARALHRERPRRAHAPRLDRQAGLRDARRPLPRLPQGAALVVGPLQGVAAVGELLRRRRRVPRVPRRAGRARPRTAACACRSTTRAGSTTGCRTGRP